jgi:hypothetical protein
MIIMFFPAFLQAVTFSFYIYKGNILRLNEAFLILALLNNITRPLTRLGRFYGQLIDF